MTQHISWINNGGRIERLLEDETAEVLCTVGEVNNQRLEDTWKAQHIIACLNFCGSVLTDALEESNLEGMYTRGAGDDLKAMAVKFRDQRDKLRQDKAELLAALGNLYDIFVHLGPPSHEGVRIARHLATVTAQAALAKHGEGA